MILATFMGQPWPRLVTRDLLVVGAFEIAFGSPLLGKVVLIAALFGILSVWNPLLLSASRLLFALGRARVVTPRFGQVHPRFGTPSVAVVFVAVVASAGVLLGRSALLPIVNVGAIAMA